MTKVCPEIADLKDDFCEFTPAADFAPFPASLYGPFRIISEVTTADGSPFAACLTRTFSIFGKITCTTTTIAHNNVLKVA